MAMPCKYSQWSAAPGTLSSTGDLNSNRDRYNTSAYRMTEWEGAPLKMRDGAVPKTERLNAHGTYLHMA